MIIIKAAFILDFTRKSINDISDLYSGFANPPSHCDVDSRNWINKN